MQLRCILNLEFNFFALLAAWTKHIHFLFNKHRANLEAVERRLWWVDNEVAQSEAKPLWVFLEINGPWTLPPHALHLTHWQRPAPVLIGWHQTISPPFSLLEREESTKCLDQYHLAFFPLGRKQWQNYIVSVLKYILWTIFRGVHWDCVFNSVLIFCCIHIREVGVGGCGGLCPDLVRTEFHQCQKFLKLPLSKGEALFHQHPQI